VFAVQVNHRIAPQFFISGAGRDAREMIGAHLCAAAAAIYAAINLVIDSKSQAVDMKEIIKMFAKDNSSKLTTQHELSCK
jgi:hypothetical protein